MYYPILFSWEQKFRFFCWVVKTTPIAGKYVKNMKGLSKPHSCQWKRTFVACTTLGDMSYFIYTRKIRIPRSRSTAIQFILSKLRKYILMNVKLKIQIRYFWFIEEILQKILTMGERRFSRKPSQPGICRIQVEELYKSYSQPPSCDRTCETRWIAEFVLEHLCSTFSYSKTFLIEWKID